MTTIITIFNLSCIFTCFLLALFRKNDWPLKVAFLFTLISDLILAGNHTAPIGVFVFGLAQLAHFWRLKPNTKFPIIFLPISIIALLAGLIANNIIILSAVYAITEIINFIRAFKFNKQLVWGFALFLACDLCVAIGFLVPSLTVALGYICWVFYAPSQFLLATSKRTVIK